LTLKTQFEKNFNDIFLDFFNIHLNIIVLKKHLKILIKKKYVFKNSKNILRINQWYKGAHVAFNHGWAQTYKGN
jgi:hypothetical protein